MASYRVILKPSVERDLLGEQEAKDGQRNRGETPFEFRGYGHDPKDHFLCIRKMVDLGSGAKREIEDIALSRYACYLIAQDGCRPTIKRSRRIRHHRAAKSWIPTFAGMTETAPPLSHI